MATSKAQVRAAVYLRISSDPTGKQLGVSRQREDCAALCAAKRWEPVEYLDNDVSASGNKRRPAYERMLDDIRDGTIGAVVCWHLDRLHRQPIELERFMELADNHRVKLATVTGDVDLSTDDGQFMARIMGAVARKEVDRKRARQLRAAQQKAERGEPQWRNAFGYLPDGSRVPDPNTAPLVRQVYSDILAGGSISDSVRMLNASKALSLRGQEWTTPTLSLFLRAPRNAGLRSHNDKIVGKGTWEPLVDESTWRAAQSVLNAPGRAPGRKSVRQHLLTGVLQCGKPECGGYLSGQWVMQAHRGGPRAHSITYACKKCRGCSVRAEHVEPLVYKAVSGRLAMDDAQDLLKAEVHDVAQAEELRAEELALLAQIREAEEEYDDGIIDGRRLAARKERVAAKLAEVVARQTDAEKARVFADLPLGTPEVEAAVAALSADRFRAVADVLFEFVVQPVGKGHRPAGGDRFDPERVAVIPR